MPEPLTLAVCAVKTVASAAALIAVGQKLGGGEGVSFETVASALEGLMTGQEAVKDFQERDRKIFAQTLNAVAKKLEALYAESLRRSHSLGFEDNVRVAFSNLAEVIARCLPNSEDFARLNHDPDRIAAAVVDNALKMQMEIFADPYGEARKILVTLVSSTYSALRAEPRFMATLEGVNWAEAFARLTRIEGTVDTVREAIERTRREVLEAIRATLPAEAQARGVPEPPLRRALEKLGASDTPTEEIPSRFDSALDELIRLRAELARMRNDRPEFATIRERASALIDAGDFSAARVELVRGRDMARSFRQEYARTEAGFLAAEARVDRLDLEYRGACEKFDEATKLDPDNLWVWIELGDLWRLVGSLAKATAAFEGAKGAAERSGAERDLSVSNSKIGDVLVSQDNLPEALKSYEAGLAIAERLVRTDAGNSDWQRDLSVSYDRIGDVLVSQGNLPEALKSYQAGLAIAERLARTDAGNSDWQRDLSVSNIKIGDVLVSQGNLPEALKSYHAGLVIRERLARTDTGNSDWQRDLSISRNKIGDVLVRQGNLPEALKSYQAGLAIAERLARTDAGNSDWQRDLIVSCVKVAQAFPDEARAMLTRAGAIANRLRDEGRLAPVDAWMPDVLARMLAALPGA